MTTKRVLFALLISFVLVFTYRMIIQFISPLVGGDIISPPAFLQRPLILPWVVFVNAAPDNLHYALISSPLLNFLLNLSFFICNVVLYAIPIFLVLKLWRKRT